MFKKIKFFFSILFLILISNHSFSANNILFIDIEYIYLNSNAGKIVSEKIKLETTKINDELAKYKKKISDDREKILSQKNILSKEEFVKKSSEHEKKIKEFNEVISKKNNELLKYRNNTKIEFTKKLSKIVQEFASKNSIEMIIKKDNILIGKNDLDATEDILNLFNKNIKSIEKE